MSRTPSPAAKAVAGATEMPATYELALEELEHLVAAMESQQLPLDQLLQGYKRGAELLGFCRTRLEAVEQQVRVLESDGLKSWGES